MKMKCPEQLRCFDKKKTGWAFPFFFFFFLFLGWAIGKGGMRELKNSKKERDCFFSVLFFKGGEVKRNSRWGEEKERGRE